MNKNISKKGEILIRTVLKTKQVENDDCEQYKPEKDDVWKHNSENEKS